MRAPQLTAEQRRRIVRNVTFNQPPFNPYILLAFAPALLVGLLLMNVDKHHINPWIMIAGVTVGVFGTVFLLSRGIMQIALAVVQTYHAETAEQDETTRNK